MREGPRLLRHPGTFIFEKVVSIFFRTRNFRRTFQNNFSEQKDERKFLPALQLRGQAVRRGAEERPQCVCFLILISSLFPEFS